jgi:hypothetical protein
MRVSSPDHTTIASARCPLHRDGGSISNSHRPSSEDTSRADTPAQSLITRWIQAESLSYEEAVGQAIAAVAGLSNADVQEGDALALMLSNCARHRVKPLCPLDISGHGCHRGGRETCTILSHRRLSCPARDQDHPRCAGRLVVRLQPSGLGEGSPQPASSCRTTRRFPCSTEVDY